MADWVAEWGGRYPCLCFGEWTLFRNGDKVDTGIPFQNEPADTFDVYQRWYFNNWIEKFESYKSGMDAHSWCENYKDWLSTLAPKEEWEAIYNAFWCEDWRYGSCGGCI